MSAGIYFLVLNAAIIPKVHVALEVLLLDKSPALTGFTTLVLPFYCVDSTPNRGFMAFGTCSSGGKYYCTAKPEYAGHVFHLGFALIAESADAADGDPTSLCLSRLFFQLQDLTCMSRH